MANQAPSYAKENAHRPGTGLRAFAENPARTIPYRLGSITYTMKRAIITIDEEKCTGCGECIPSCPEGAIQIIDGKARLVSDLMCDGIGACLGHCPEGAIAIEEREAEPYDERKVMDVIVRQGVNTLRAHLDHLRDHNQTDYLSQALAYLADHGIPNPVPPAADPVPRSESATPHTAPAPPTPDPQTGFGKPQPPALCAGGCPGSRSMSLAPDREDTAASAIAGSLAGTRLSRLTHWPVQMHLINPAAPHYEGTDLLLAADCVAYSLGDFHRDWLSNRTLAIACPKLDENQQVYLSKFTALIDTARINTLTVMIMQVPCCRGLLGLAQKAAAQAARKVPVKAVVVSLDGRVLQEEWV